MTPLERRDLIDHFREVLQSATEHRRERDYWVEGDTSRELGWVIWEREQMHAAVNAELERRALPPVPLERITRIEQQAVGHSDYVAQWAIRCADLVLASTEGSER